MGGGGGGRQQWLCDLQNNCFGCWASPKQKVRTDLICELKKKKKEKNLHVEAHRCWFIAVEAPGTTALNLVLSSTDGEGDFIYLTCDLFHTSAPSCPLLYVCARACV